MYLLRSLLTLPAPLLLLLLSSGSDAQALDDALHRGLDWPPHLKYFPEDHLLRRHNGEAIEEHIRDGKRPSVVRKMSEDEGEMFFPEYWGFQGRNAESSRMAERGMYDDLSRSLRREYEEEDDWLLANASAQFSLRPAFAVHENPPIPPPDLIKARARHMNAAGALGALQKRAFQCPSGTSACLSISQPNYCCATSEDCVTITDTGLGPVGCCPSGGSCSGEIKTCAASQTACPQSMGGACCVAGYTCFDVGCVSSVVVTAIQTVAKSQSTSSSIVTPTTTTATTTAECGGAADYTPCPADLGGGCCLTGRICATGTSCPLPGDFTTTEAPGPPVRGTGESSSTPTPTTIASGDACPTGFYACSAYYPGAGCCRIGRDCSETFCPSTASATLITEGKTIAVPLVPDATTTASGSCASGWASCAADVGGNCCPSGWVCGSQSCSSADASSTAVVGKDQVALNSSPHVASRASRLMIVMAVFSGLLIK